MKQFDFQESAPAQVGKIIKEYRLRNNMTQIELAHYLYVVPQTISNWENGLRSPSINVLRNLSIILNCKMEDFLMNNRSVKL